MKALSPDEITMIPAYKSRIWNVWRLYLCPRCGSPGKMDSRCQCADLRRRLVTVVPPEE